MTPLNACCDDLQIISARYVNSSGIAGPAPDELLWALRGAGHNHFGIVTQLVLRTVPAATTLTRFHVECPLTLAIDAILHWQRIAPHWPRSVASMMTLRRHATRVHLTGSSENPSDANFVVRQSLLFPAHNDTLCQIRIDPHPVDYAKASQFASLDGHASLGGPYPKLSRRMLSESAFVKRVLTRAQVERFVQTIVDESGAAGESDCSPDSMSTDKCDTDVFWEAMGGRIGDEDLARRSVFAHRQARLLMSARLFYADEERRRLLAPWFERMRQVVRSLGEGAYVNYPSASASLEDYYGRRGLERLVSLKRRYDPENVFRFEQSVPVDKCVARRFMNEL